MNGTDIVLPSNDTAKTLQYAFLISFLVYVCSIPFMSSRKSWFDAVAAQKMMYVLRFFISVEAGLNAYLLYSTMAYGVPFSNQFTAYGNGSSWVYGFGRPCTGLVFISFGGIADMHPGPRIICMLFSLAQLVFDAFSAYQTADYFIQVAEKDAPWYANHNEYTMQVYYWRDVISFGVAFVIFLLICHASILLGMCGLPLIPYQKIEGRDLDRVDIMHKATYVMMDGLKRGKDGNPAASQPLTLRAGRRDGPAGPDKATSDNANANANAIDDYDGHHREEGNASDGSDDHDLDASFDGDIEQGLSVPSARSDLSANSHRSSRSVLSVSGRSRSRASSSGKGL